MASSKEINSFAVFDLETTGLPGYNFNKTNITELTIHGFAAENVRNSNAPNNRRVNHSLTLVFNPRMMIAQKAEEITGLNNYMLEKESSFDENAANTVISFLKHLRQPVCLVAHNGTRFDFPILKDAFKKLKMELPPDVMCLDSYTAIQGLDKKRIEDKAALLTDEINTDNDSLLENEDFKLNTIPFLNDDEAPLVTTDDTTPPKTTAVNFKQPDHISENINTENITIKSEKDDEKNPVDWQKINETTPKQGIKTRPTVSRKLKADSVVVSKTPKQRRLDFTTPTQAASPSRPPVGFYKLENIYIRLFNEKPKVTHQAEADVILLKDVMFKYGDAFVKWAEENAKPFSSVKPLSGF